MQRRTWSADEKLAIVVAGLRNHQSIAELCREHQMSQTQYYKWRDQFLAGALKGLSGAVADPEHQQRREIERYGTAQKQLDYLMHLCYIGEHG